VAEIDKKKLSERDICTKYIMPAILRAGWDLEADIREEVNFTDGRVIARGNHHTRGKQKRADFILNYQNIRLAIVEANRNELSVGHGMQQAINYARILQVPFVFTSNGDGWTCQGAASPRGNFAWSGLGAWRRRWELIPRSDASQVREARLLSSFLGQTAGRSECALWQETADLSCGS
jgi:type I site-specific restriction endonuclease